MHTYYILMAVMAILAVVVFVALFFFKAGYGYLSGSNWGPKINNRTAWIIMECPAFLFMLIYTVRHAVSGTDTGNSDTVLYIIAGLFLVHYFQRSFVFPLLIRGKGQMPVAIMLMGMVFNTANSYFIGAWLYRFAPAGTYTMEWIASPQFIIGTLVFITGMLINLDSDYVIRQWIGYAILTWSPAGLLFAVWTFANLAPRAKSLTAKYEEEFGDEYRNLHRKNLIPFIW